MPGPYAVRIKTASGWQDIILQGPVGPTGPQGPTGATGAAGPGVPVGGAINQVLAKKTAADFDTQWVAQSGGSGTSSKAFGFFCGGP